MKTNYYKPFYEKYMYNVILMIFVFVLLLYFFNKHIHFVIVVIDKIINDYAISIEPKAIATYIFLIGYAITAFTIKIIAIILYKIFYYFIGKKV